MSQITKDDPIQLVIVDYTFYYCYQLHMLFETYLMPMLSEIDRTHFLTKNAMQNNQSIYSKINIYAIAKITITFTFPNLHTYYD